MINLGVVHSKLIRRHIKLFENIITVNAETDHEFEISVIWNDITRMDPVLGISDVLGSKASVFIDYETLHNLGKDIVKGDSITGKPNRFEEMKTYRVSDSYFDKHMTVKVCFLKENQNTDFSEDL